MTVRMQAAICVVLAVCVLVLFFWPAVPLRVSRAPYSVRPAHTSVSMAAAATPNRGFGAQWLSAQQARLATRGPYLLDLTTARLC